MIKRTTLDRQFATAKYGFGKRYKQWQDIEHCVVVEGEVGCGKTTSLIQFVRAHNAFYFSFKNTSGKVALQLFTEALSKKISITQINNWDDAFDAVKEYSKRQTYFVFDDFDYIFNDVDFKKSFSSYYFNKKRMQIFLVLSLKAGSESEKQFLSAEWLTLNYFSIAEIRKRLPSKNGIDIVDIYAMTGGIPALVDEYDNTYSFWDNVKKLCNCQSTFRTFMPNLLSEIFRRTEAYYSILYAIACGYERVSEIANFTGFANNKCDNYLKALIHHRILSYKKDFNEQGLIKGYYRFANSYYKMWFVLIYPNRTRLFSENDEYWETVFRQKFKEISDEQYIAACFRLVENKAAFNATAEQLRRKKRVISTENFHYFFDAFLKDCHNQGLYVKILIDEGFGKKQIEAFNRAISMVHPFYESEMFVFSKVSFSKTAFADANNVEEYHLVPVERLRY